MTSSRPWSDVRKLILANRARTVEALVTAAPDAVPALQIRVQVLDDVVRWFESGSPADTMIGETADSEIPGY